MADIPQRGLRIQTLLKATGEIELSLAEAPATFSSKAPTRASARSRVFFLIMVNPPFLCVFVGCEPFSAISVIDGCHELAPNLWVIETPATDSFNATIATSQ